MSDSTDFAVSLPTDTGTFTASSMLPVGLLDTNHVLLLADDVAPDEVEALALSQDIQSGWVGVSSLQLFPGVSLLGPWKVDAEMRRLLGAPEWTTQLMILDCPRIRAGALPSELAGLDPLSDAFPKAQPTGAELVALTRLRAIARRLAGALRLIPGGDKEDPVLVEPSPEVSASLTVYAPVWLGPDDLVAVLHPVAPETSAALEAVRPQGAVGLDAIDPEQLERLVERIGPEVFEQAWRSSEKVRQDTMRQEIVAAATGNVIEELRDGYAVVTPVDPEHEGWGRIEVRAGAPTGFRWLCAESRGREERSCPTTCAGSPRTRPTPTPRWSPAPGAVSVRRPGTWSRSSPPSWSPPSPGWPWTTTASSSPWARTLRRPERSRQEVVRAPHGP